MFCIDPSPTFTAPARITKPSAAAPEEFTVTWRHKGPEQLDAWWNAARARPSAEALAEVIVGWSGVFDAAGADVPYSPEALARLIGNYAPAAHELLFAYTRALTESRLKN